MNQQQSFKKLQRAFAIRGIVAPFAFLGVIVALLPLAPALHQFFRDHVGGTLGECLLGLSFPLIASPPVIAFLVWAIRNEWRFIQTAEQEVEVSRSSPKLGDSTE